jgi:hypothetical protein
MLVDSFEASTRCEARDREGNGGEVENNGVMCIAKTLNSLEIINVLPERGM